MLQESSSPTSYIFDHKRAAAYLNHNPGSQAAEPRPPSRHRSHLGSVFAPEYKKLRVHGIRSVLPVCLRRAPVQTQIVRLLPR